jgi:hypothetical protein
MAWNTFEPQRDHLAKYAILPRQIDPSGITSDFQKSCQAPESKIFLFPQHQITSINSHPVPRRGALAIVTNVGRVAVDAGVPSTNGANAYGEAAWSWRLDAGVKF